MLLSDIKNDTNPNAGLHYINLIWVTSFLVIAILIDYHMTQVILYKCKLEEKRIAREKKEAAKKIRAIERFKRHNLQNEKNDIEAKYDVDRD